MSYDAQRVFHAVNLKGSEHQPLLPFVNDTTSTVTSSPLYEYIASNEREDDLPGIAEHLARQHGPWQLTIKMKVPAKLQASHDYPDSNVKVAHNIRVTLRVGTGDTDSEKKSGAFDVTMEFPCRIVSVCFHSLTPNHL